MLHSPGRQFAMLHKPGQSQQLQKGIVATKTMIFQPFSTKTVHEFTKVKGYGMKLNLIADTNTDSPLLKSMQCTLTCCNLEQGSNRVSVALRNILDKKITIPAKAVIHQLQ